MPLPYSLSQRRQFLQWMLSTSAAASLPSALTGCSKGLPLCAPDQWSNAVGTLCVRPTEVTAPASAAEIVAIVKRAEATRKRVRMTGSGHSFSDVAAGDGVLLLPTRLSGLLELDRQRLKPALADDKHFVRVQSGITIRKLNDELDAMGLALENLGGYDGQTITGVAMTATHGSGLAYGPIVSQIVSLQIVVSGGEVLQIEPKDGITDRDALEKGGSVLEEDPKIKVRLVQDDDLFAAVSVSMGCMGVVYAVVLKTVDRFWIREKRQIHMWSELAAKGGLIERIIAGQPINSSGKDPDHYEIYINPYITPQPGGGHRCMYTERYRLDQAGRRTPQNSMRGGGGSGGFFSDPQIVKMAGNALRDYFDGAKAELLHGTLDVMLDFLRDDDYTDLGYRVFNLGDANHFRVYGIETAFPIENTIVATERMFRLAGEYESKGWHHTVPVSLRFVAPSKSHLAMQYGRRTCMMEIGVLVGAKGADDLLKGYEEAFLGDPKLGARPHWGLDLDVLNGQNQVRALYPAFDKWKAAYDTLNKSGVFNGRVTDRLGISR